MRQPILAMLNAYQQRWCSGELPYTSWDRSEEEAALLRLTRFVEEHEDCFSRENTFGHITGSAFVINREWDRVLLTLHAKLGKWLQLGGHSDDDPRTDRVAWREAEEESGLKTLSWARSGTVLGNDTLPLPFDCDVHWIPARPNEPAHWHFDLRFLIVADDNEALQISEESKDLRWLSLDEARKITTERSMHRPFEKIVMLKDHLKDDAILREDHQTAFPTA